MRRPINLMKPSGTSETIKTKCILDNTNKMSASNKQTNKKTNDNLYISYWIFKKKNLGNISSTNPEYEQDICDYFVLIK